MARTGTRQSRANASDGNSSDELSYSEAQTALELALAQLQSSDLPVEAMADLYQRARAYAQRCEQVLDQVEQSIDVWDPEQADTAPQPLQS